MKFNTGDGLVCFIPAHAISSIKNYRELAPSTPHKNMCEITTVQGERFVANVSAEEAWSSYWWEVKEPRE